MVLGRLKVEATANDGNAHPAGVLHGRRGSEQLSALQAVTLTADVRDDPKTVGQTNLRHLTQCGVRLRSRGKHRYRRSAFVASLERGNLLLETAPAGPRTS